MLAITAGTFLPHWSLLRRLLFFKRVSKSGESCRLKRLYGGLCFLLAAHRAITSAGSHCSLCIHARSRVSPAAYQPHILARSCSAQGLLGSSILPLLAS